MPRLIKSSASIVVVGALSPAVFHPAWFAANGLLRQGEADAAEITVITPEISLFKTEWLSVDVRTNRLQIQTEQEPYFPVLRDLAIGILTLQPHVPVSALGLNWMETYQCNSADAWHQFGHLLAPKEPWGAEFAHWGTIQVHVRGQEEEGGDSYSDFRVGPANGVQHGIAIQMNDHHAFEHQAVASSTPAKEAAENDWETSYRRFQSVAQSLIAQVDE